MILIKIIIKFYILLIDSFYIILPNKKEISKRKGFFKIFS
jgi:hypothetical protein